MTDRRIDVLLDQAEAALDSGDLEGALALCDEVLAAQPDHPDALYLSAQIYRTAGALEEAEDLYRRVCQLVSDQSVAWSGLGAVLFDRLEFEQAKSPLLKAIRLDPANPEAYYWRALARERRGDLAGAQRDFRRAALLDPEAYPLPVPLDDSLIEAVVSEVVSSLHPSIQSYLAQVSFLLEEVPDEDVLRQFDPPMPPGELLGFYTGTSLADRSVEDPWSNLPAVIILYRRNLQRVAPDRTRMLEELRVTVFHEIGHHLGLDEDDLAARGLD